MVAAGLPYSWRRPCATRPCPASTGGKGPSLTAGLVGRAPDMASVVCHMSYCHEMSVCLSPPPPRNKNPASPSRIMQPMEVVCHAQVHSMSTRKVTEGFCPCEYGDVSSSHKHKNGVCFVQINRGAGLRGDHIAFFEMGIPSMQRQAGCEAIVAADPHPWPFACPQPSLIVMPMSLSIQPLESCRTWSQV